MWFRNSRSLTLTCWLNQLVETAPHPCSRNAEEKRFAVVWLRRTVEPPRFVHGRRGDDPDPAQPASVGVVASSMCAAARIRGRWRMIAMS